MVASSGTFQLSESPVGDAIRCGQIDPVSNPPNSVLPQQASAVGVAVQSVINASRRERGCLTCSLATEMCDPVTLRLREVWDSEPSLHRHVQSRRFSTLAGLLETAIDPPRFEVAVDGRVRGFDSVGEVRQDGESSAGTRQGLRWFWTASAGRPR